MSLGLELHIIDFISSTPFFTRFYLLACLLFTFLVQQNLISSFHIFYTPTDAFIKGQIWRIITPFLFIEKLNLLFAIIFCSLYWQMKKMEKNIKNGAQYSRFLWMIAFIGFGCLIAGSVINIYFFTDSFITAVIYVTSRNQPQSYFIKLEKTQIKNKYFPYFYLAVMFLFGHRFIKYLIGFCIGIFYDYCNSLPSNTLLSKLPSPPQLVTTTIATHLPIFEGHANR